MPTPVQYIKIMTLDDFKFWNSFNTEVLSVLDREANHFILRRISSKVG